MSQRATGHVIMWRFVVSEAHRADFEAAYGPSGTWAELFGSAPGYEGTDLIRLDRAGIYVTIDHWASNAAYQRFRHARRRHYDELDARCARLTDAEDFLGSGTIAYPSGLLGHRGL